MAIAAFETTTTTSIATPTTPTTSAITPNGPTTIFDVIDDLDHSFLPVQDHGTEEEKLVS
jgi:hypothetical protein